MQSKHSAGITRRTTTIAASIAAAAVSVITIATVDFDSATAERVTAGPVVNPVGLADFTVAPEPQDTVPAAPAATAMQAPTEVLSDTAAIVSDVSDRTAAEAAATTTTTAPPPPTTAAPTTAPPPPPPPTEPEIQAAPVPAGSVWDALAQCESGGNWSINTGNGYYGGLQFSISSWRGVGGTGYPHEHSREHQIEMGERLKANGGWGHWPACSRKLGLR